MQKMDILVDNHSFSISKLDKIFWPEDKYTKGDLIKYYMDISPYILKHLYNRPVVFTRYPDGIEGKHFYQKNAPAYLPSWIETFSQYSKDSERYIEYILIKEAAVLAWLANQACIELHAWLSSISSLDYPDFAVIDLDPSPDNSFQEVIDIALLVKNVFHELNLRSYPKTSGSEGLHIYLPLKNIYTYNQVREFARAVAALTAEIRPDISTIERTVSKRGPKIYIDYLQNVKGQTLCSAYSVRPRKGALVSAPLKWEEVPLISPADFTIKTILPRLKKAGELFSPVLEDKQVLEHACQKLGLQIS
ncbi:atp-dependent dna ligase clustered with ku protein, ligd [hydrocarbon metagenome]|uniref:Atp-dependent dna ligase clustered with ku protein, ligd n=1 Tax=hydrocarbon metagenome TaxID=938273 RepID=A0A0W8E7W7_9ZZZZ